jgi:3-dehydrosphinganine reductase
MHESFAAQHAIITGGTSGIGRALVERLAAVGARVSTIALEDEDLAALAADNRPGVRVLAADVSDREQAAAAVAEAERLHGPADLVVTCAGVVRPGHFGQLPPEEHEREMQVNYFGTLWTIRAAAPAMTTRRRGAIMAVSSFAGLVGVFGYTAYCPSKFAVRGLCECLRAELKPYGVHVGCVFPPDTDTPMLAAEVPLKPPEAQASSMLPVLSARQVADAILSGARHRRARVYPGQRTRAFARAVMALPGVTAAVNDRDVARHPPER